MAMAEAEAEAMAEAEADVEECVNYMLMVRREAARKDEEAQEEAERRKRAPGGKMKKRKTVASKSSKKAAAAEESGLGKAEASSPAKPDLSRISAIIKAKKAEILAGSNGGVIKKPPAKTMTEQDVAAAAVFRAKAEEARRNHWQTAEFNALTKWIATGDPEAVKCRKAWLAEDMEALRLKDVHPGEDTSDWEAFQAKKFREFWEFLWSGSDSFGRYEDTTVIPSMLYTDKKSDHARPTRTLQVFSVKVAGLEGGLHWPLDVFGIVAARDCLDHNRNIIFGRERDNCQKIDMENPYLTLTGPTRAIVVVDPVWFEVALQVKGATESDDKELSCLVRAYYISGSFESGVFNRVGTSKLSTMELTLGDIVRSVEATITVRVVGGEWPEGFRGVIFASTTSLDDMKIELLDSGEDKLRVAADGTIQLARCVVSVEVDGHLRVSVMAHHMVDRSVQQDSRVLAAKKSSRSYANLELVSCKMEVTVAWSLPPYSKHFRDMPVT